METIDPRIKFPQKEWFTFTLNKHEKIVIKFDVHEILECCHQSKIYFIHYNHKILLAHWTVRENIETFIKILELALNNQLFLNPEFKEEIGTLWNFACTKKNKQDSFNDETQREQNELRSYLAFGNNQAAMWIYNNSYENIIFKITPVFENWKPQRKQPKYSTFLHWMKKYKPILIRSLPKSIAEQWLEQATQIYKIIEHNIDVFGQIALESYNKKVAQAKLDGTYEAMKIAENELAEKQRAFDRKYSEIRRKRKNA